MAVDPASGAERWRLPWDPAWGEDRSLVAAVSLADGAVGLLLEDESSLLVAVDAATGQRRWDVEVGPAWVTPGRTVQVAQLDGVTVVANRAGLWGYDETGRELWDAASPPGDRAPELLDYRLVVDQGRLFAVGVDVFEVDPSDGNSRMVREDVFASDVAIVDDLLVIATGGALEAVPLD